MGKKPLFISTPRGDKSPFDGFWKIKRSELEAAKMYRDTMRETPKLEKLLKQKDKNHGGEVNA